MANTDRRIRRTCKSLHEALISLLLEKNYDEITVQEILDRTDVGRSTFYAHFEGKDELLVSGIHDLRTWPDLRGQNCVIDIAISIGVVKHRQWISQCLSRNSAHAGLATCKPAPAGAAERIDRA